MYSLKSKYQKLVLSFLAILLFACGGIDPDLDPSIGADPEPSIGAEPKPKPDPDPNKIIGKAADGYLRGALVCLDSNKNGRCDTAEPRATTTEGGVYNIDIPDGTDRNKPLVVEVPATAIDEDTNIMVGQAYTMKAPAGKHGFVSPTTTLVQQELENNPSLSVNDAEAAVKNNMHFNASDISLFTDYVTASKDTRKTAKERAQYIQIHKIARVVAQAVSTNQAAIDKVATAAGIDKQSRWQELFALAMASVKSKLSAIASEVAADTAATAKDLDIVRIQKDVEVTLDVDTANIKSKLDEKKQELSKSIATLDDLIQSPLTGIGVYWASRTNNNVVLNNITFSQKDMTVTTSRYEDSLWQLLQNDSSSVTFNPKTNKWVTAKNISDWAISKAENGRFVAEDSETGAVIRYSVAKTDLTDQQVANYPAGSDTFIGFKKWLQDKGNLDATFPPGSTSFTLDLFRAVIRLHVRIEGGNSQGICKTLSDGTNITVSQLNGNCNAIYVNSGALTSLDKMFTATVDTAKTTINIETFSIYANKFNWYYYDLIASTGDTGSIRYYLEGDRSTSGDPRQYALAPEQGTWEKKTVGGEEIIWLSHPKVLNGKSIQYSRHNKEFFIQYNGFVRRGNYTPANDHFVGGYSNKTATEAVLRALGITTNPP